MADIRITQPHSLPPATARAAAQKVADQLAMEYGLASKWMGDALHFRRDGVSGKLSVLESKATLEVSLGFLFKAFAPTIERKALDGMRKVFEAA